MVQNTYKAKQKIKRLHALDQRKFEIWRFFENRADEIKGRLWTTTTWLVTLKGALLAFMFSKRMITFTGCGIGISPKFPFVWSVLSGLGLILAVLTWAIVDDITGHIRANWLRASAAMGDDDLIQRSGRIYILWPLLVVETFFSVAFLILLGISFNNSAVDWIVISFVLLTALSVVIYKYKMHKG